MVSWYVDKGLEVFINEMKALYPGIVIGTIGDQSHQNRDSDHNPEDDGSVDAADPMLGAHFTRADADKTVAALVKNRDRRIAYIIWERRIISSTPQSGYAAWEWRPYKGSDSHTEHFHMSVNDAHENDRSTWDLSMSEKAPKLITIPDVQLPDIGEGDSDLDFTGYNIITRIQNLKRIKPDGEWGPITTQAVGAKRMTVALYQSIFGLA